MSSRVRLARISALFISGLIFLAFLNCRLSSTGSDAANPAPEAETVSTLASAHFDYIDYMYEIDAETTYLLRNIRDENAGRSKTHLSRLIQYTDEFIDYAQYLEEDSRLTQDMLVPLLNQLQKELDRNPVVWNQVRQRAGVMVGSCNACHTVTGVSSIRVHNPFTRETEAAQEQADEDSG